MESNATHKKLTVLKRPVLLFDCELPDGRTERWSTHSVAWGELRYEARVLRSGNFSMSAWNVDGGVGNSRLQLSLANTDAYALQVEGSCGWKHAKLTVWFCFMDVETGEVATLPEAVYSGVANPPEEVTERHVKLGFNNRLNLEKLTLPTVRIQPRCPWAFPTSLSQRTEAQDGGARGAYSAFYGCGYSADVPGGCGNLNGGTPFTTCNRTKADCLARGMYRSDASGKATARFGGFQFLPPTIQVRAHGEKQVRLAEAEAGTARNGDPAPLLYGTTWVQPSTVFSRSDGNFLHFEALLGSGPIEEVRRVLADGKEIPRGVAGVDYGATGWWNLLSRGERKGEFNPAFADGTGVPLGDPHGSTAILTLALPQKDFANGRPKLQVLCDGLRLNEVDPGGGLTPPAFTANPGWVMLDILRRCGWMPEELNLLSFRSLAEWCDQLVTGTDNTGAEFLVPRAKVGMAVSSARSASDLLRGIQANANCLLYLDHDGKLAVRAEGPIEQVQPTLRSHSNSTALLNGGWPAYEFGDGSNGSDGVLMDDRGAARLRMWSRPTGQCPTRYQMEFQDSTSDYRQSTLSLVDIDELAKSAQEVSSTHPALGVTTGTHAGAILRLALHKALRGNQFLEIETSVQAIGLRPGDLVAVSLTDWGLDRALFRVLAIEPRQNYESVLITAQKHDDAWYSGPDFDVREQSSLAGWRCRLPRPLAGNVIGADGEESFEVAERAVVAETQVVQLEVGFSVPPSHTTGTAPAPLVSAGETAFGASGLGNGTWFYAFSHVDSGGTESGLSLVQTIRIPIGAPPAHVRFDNLGSWATTNVTRIYRGRTPQTLRRIADVAAGTTQFTDTGTAATTVPAPDPAFFEARFYWRHELVGPMAVEAAVGTSLHAPAFQVAGNGLVGRVVRVLSGTAAGEENRIVALEAGTIFVEHEWNVLPEAGSRICVCEESWRPGGHSRSGAATIEMPNRPGSTIHLIGVSANAAGEESEARLAPFMRLRITGDTSSAPDTDVPGAPSFAVANAPQGRLRLSNLGVTSLENTKSVHSATLRTHFIDELAPQRIVLGSPMAAETTEFVVSAGDPLEAGAWVVLEGELMQVIERLGPQAYAVVRGGMDSIASAHEAGVEAFQLTAENFSVPLAGGFFGSPAASNFSAEWPFQNRRLAAAELFLTNSVGDGAPARLGYAMLEDGGIRFPLDTMFAIQFAGLAAVKSGIAPSLRAPADYSIQTLAATLAEAPLGGLVVVRVRAGEAEIGRLEFLPGDRIASCTHLTGFASLRAGEELVVDILDVPGLPGSWPGRDLSVSVAV